METERRVQRQELTGSGDFVAGFGEGHSGTDHGDAVVRVVLNRLSQADRPQQERVVGLLAGLQPPNLGSGTDDPDPRPATVAARRAAASSSKLVGVALSLTAAERRTAPDWPVARDRMRRAGGRSIELDAREQRPQSLLAADADAVLSRDRAADGNARVGDRVYELLCVRCFAGDTGVVEDDRVEDPLACSSGEHDLERAPPASLQDTSDQSGQARGRHRRILDHKGICRPPKPR